MYITIAMYIAIKKSPISIATNVFALWICIIVVLMSVFVVLSNPADKRFYRWGPHDDFAIMGVPINTPIRYMVLVLYSFINSVFRTVHRNFLTPWLINNVQDESRDKKHIKPHFAYEVTTVIVVYNWVDWLLYMNILMAQIDMVVVEIVADLITSLFTSYYYLRLAPSPEELVPLSVEQ